MAAARADSEVKQATHRTVRFVVFVDGEACELFRIKERLEDGNLTILSRRARHTDHPLLGRAETKFDKTSVHPRRGGYTTIKSAVEFVTDPGLSKARKIDLAQGGFALVMARIFPWFFNSNMREKDRYGEFIVLGDYNPRVQTFVYAVFVCDVAYDLESTLHFAHVPIEFLKYRVLIFPNTPPISSTGSGSTMSAPGRQLWHTDPRPESAVIISTIPESDLFPFIQSIAQTMSRKLLGNFARTYGKTPEYFAAKEALGFSDREDFLDRNNTNVISWDWLRDVMERLRESQFGH